MQFAAYVLRRWRVFAEWAAKIRGARRACSCCYRAMNGQASVVVRPPWATQVPRKRWLCSECWTELVNLLDEWSYTRDNYDLPIDRVSSRETKGAHRGQYTKR
jgi:hypothetical protein